MSDPTRLSAEVSALLRHVAATELRPRRSAAVAREKAPGEVVTDADVAAERALTEGLARLTPGVMVIGEEAAHEDPRLLTGLAQHAEAWLVDPLDGTGTFAAGEGPYGIMLALLRHGVTQAAWIHLPESDELAHARRGEGAWLDDRPVRVASPSSDATLRGGLLMRFFPDALRAHADEAAATAGYERTDGAHHCAAERYVALLRGEEQFAAYWRTLPWDHAPGALLVAEAGGSVARFDGRPYEPADIEGTSLLVASSTGIADAIRRTCLAL